MWAFDLVVEREKMKSEVETKEGVGMGVGRQEKRPRVASRFGPSLLSLRPVQLESSTNGRHRTFPRNEMPADPSEASVKSRGKGVKKLPGLKRTKTGCESLKSG